MPPLSGFRGALVEWKGGVAFCWSFLKLCWAFAWRVAGAVSILSVALIPLMLDAPVWLYLATFGVGCLTIVVRVARAVADLLPPPVVETGWRFGRGRLLAPLDRRQTALLASFAGLTTLSTGFGLIFAMAPLGVVLKVATALLDRAVVQDHLGPGLALLTESGYLVAGTQLQPLLVLPGVAAILVWFGGLMRRRCRVPMRDFLLLAIALIFYAFVALAFEGAGGGMGTLIRGIVLLLIALLGGRTLLLGIRARRGPAARGCRAFRWLVLVWACLPPALGTLLIDPEGAGLLLPAGWTEIKARAERAANLSERCDMDGPVWQRLLLILERFDFDLERLSRESSLVQDLDDLGRVELIMALEEGFGIEIPDRDAERLSSAGGFCGYFTAWGWNDD